MVIPAIIIAVTTARGVVKIHQGVRDDNGVKLVFGSMGIFLMVGFLDEYILKPAESSPKRDGESS